MSSPVDAILERIEAQRSFASTTLLLQEQGEAVIHDASTWRTLLSIPANSLIRMGLTLDAELVGQVALNVVRCGNVIGSARLSSEVGEVAITIEPKVSAKRLVSIIDFLQSDSCFSDDLTET